MIVIPAWLWLGVPVTVAWIMVVEHKRDMGKKMTPEEKAVWVVIWVVVIMIIGFSLAAHNLKPTYYGEQVDLRLRGYK